MTQEIATNDIGKRLEEVLVQGNLSVLTPVERTEYYRRVCESVGLNPLTQPLSYLTLNGKLVLYANKGATDQLRQVHGISIEITDRTMMADAALYVVTARATDRNGRSDESTGAVTVAKLAGEQLANSLMRAETKAKRRATLSLTGLGMLDEMEVESIPESAKRPPVQMPQARIPVDTETGEIQTFAEKNGEPFESPPAAAAIWPAFWAKAQEVGYDEQQVRDFVNVDPESFDSMTRADLQGVLRDLRAAANPQPALIN